MEVLRYKYIFVLLGFFLNSVRNEKLSNYNNTVHTTPKCPFTKLVEDIFKMRNKTITGDIDSKEKFILNSLADITTDDKSSNRSVQDALVDNIIASINRIKNNITRANDDESNLNEAIILNIPKQLEKIDRRNDEINISGIKSGIEEKYDVKLNTSKDDNENPHNATSTTTAKPTYVEILTIEPNNTNVNQTTSHNIIEVLKHLMPMFNSTLTKELHNITIIERNHDKNHSFSATKNVSTIIVTYCDNENYTKANVSYQNAETDLKIPEIPDKSTDDDYLDGEDEYEYEDFRPEVNLTKSEKKDIMEAAEYGMQKMHELYAVMEPKLYSMGLWLDDSNPARYVAAFNAPSEDAAKFYRYGYASLQAAAKLRQLTSCANCGGPHPANHIGCPTFRREARNKKAGPYAITKPTRPGPATRATIEKPTVAESAPASLMAQANNPQPRGTAQPQRAPGPAGSTKAKKKKPKKKTAPAAKARSTESAPTTSSTANTTPAPNAAAAMLALLTQLMR